MRTAIVLLICSTLFLSSSATAADERALEAQLVDAMRLKKGSLERVGDSGVAIRAYIQNGYLDKRPNKRSDYTDYYLLKQPAKFMGHTLMVIEEEYMTKYIGCCVSPGVGIAVRINGSTKNLEEFAKENGCHFSDDANLQYVFSHLLNGKVNLPEGTYVSLSCRERDARK